MKWLLDQIGQVRIDWMKLLSSLRISPTLIRIRKNALVIELFIQGH
jgi:hypothetical protein